YAHWDPVCVDFMVTSAMEFISSTALEGREDIIHMSLSPSAKGLPKYVRGKTGMTAGFACAAFTRAAHPDITTYIQALPEMDEYLGVINDILSFYKEDHDGETMNYVSLHAKMSGKHAEHVLVGLVEEAGVLHRRILTILKGNPDALAEWVAFLNGGIAWHLSLSRYKLSELGFTW
ncbi:isoprenoid synthase domain-containing protein, partial [Mycena epipterygia]